MQKRGAGFSNVSKANVVHDEALQSLRSCAHQLPRQTWITLVHKFLSKVLIGQGSTSVNKLVHKDEPLRHQAQDGRKRVQQALSARGSRLWYVLAHPVQTIRFGVIDRLVS